MLPTKWRLILWCRMTIHVLSEEVTIQAAHALSLTVSGGFFRSSVDLARGFMLCWVLEERVSGSATLDTWVVYRQNTRNLCTCIHVLRHTKRLPKEHWHLTPLLSPVLALKGNSKAHNLKTIFKSLKQVFNIVLGFEQNKHDKCSLIHYSTTWYLLFLISPFKRGFCVNNI